VHFFAGAVVQGAQPRVDGCDYVFAGRTSRTPFSGFSKAKSALDKATGVAGWTLYDLRRNDLRRTAKTLMARAGVRPDISERILGHVIAGVARVYDRHSRLDEKREALVRLAAIVERILGPALADVVPLDERRQRAALTWHQVGLSSALYVRTYVKKRLGSRAFSAFSVEEEALMMVASTIVPAAIFSLLAARWRCT
jgi:hypothetical protein